MQSRTRAVRALGGLIGVAAALGVVAAPVAADGAQRERWDVTFAMRVIATKRSPLGMRLALPLPGHGQHASRVEVRARGLAAEVDETSAAPHVRFTGKLEGARRVAVRYRVTTERPSAPRAVEVKPLERPDPALLPYLAATPMFQARSIIVREFLETHVSPLLETDDPPDLLHAIHTATRGQIQRARDGKTLVLDVVRRRRAQRLGIERAFTTFLRCAGVPARMIEGIDLESSTRRKRVFWTEVWAGHRWEPVSASRGWIGRLPASYVALSRDGVRVLQVDSASGEDITATYVVEAESLSPKRVPSEE
jgi:hypothetical protein